MFVWRENHFNFNGLKYCGVMDKQMLESVPASPLPVWPWVAPVVPSSILVYKKKSQGLLWSQNEGLGSGCRRRVTIQISAFPFYCSDQGPNIEMKGSEVDLANYRALGVPRCTNEDQQAGGPPCRETEVTCIASRLQSPPESAECWGVRRWHSWHEVLPLGRTERQ